MDKENKPKQNPVCAWIRKTDQIKHRKTFCARIEKNIPARKTLTTFMINSIICIHDINTLLNNSVINAIINSHDVNTPSINSINSITHFHDVNTLLNTSIINSIIYLHDINTP